jgi:DNA-binding protein Fis
MRGRPSWRHDRPNEQKQRVWKMSNRDALQDCVRASLERYFKDLGDAEPHDIYAMVMHCVERPVLEVALERAAGNQSRASEMLGITRNTLRKKLIAHHIEF